MNQTWPQGLAAAIHERLGRIDAVMMSAAVSGPEIGASNRPVAAPSG